MAPFKVSSFPAIFLFMGLALLALSCSRQLSYPPAPQIGPNIVIDTSSLEPGAPKFYTYRYEGKNVNYFILKVQGEVNAFLDACVSCYPDKRGYRCNNGSITCRACDLTIPVYKLEKGIRGCYPIKIEGRTVNGEYRIPRKILETAADKF